MGTWKPLAKLITFAEAQEELMISAPLFMQSCQKSDEFAFIFKLIHNQMLKVMKKAMEELDYKKQVETMLAGLQLTLLPQ